MPIIQRLGSASARGFGFGKTGVTHQRVVQESATITDATNRAVSYDSVISETSTATDAIASLLNSLNQVLEVATGSDSIQGERGYISVVNETATISDLISTIGNQNITVAEIATATDAVANIGSFARSVTETGSITDTPQGSILTINNIVEAGTASDVITTGRTTSGVISEVALGEDETERLALANGVINETATGADVTAVSVSPAYWLSTFYGATVSDFQYLLSGYVDANENIYATGSGSGDGASSGVNVLKYDKDGALQWQRKLDANFTHRGYAITTDSSGNVFVAGGYDDSGNTAPPGGVRGFIVKLNSSGTIEWQNLFWPSQTSPIQQSNLSTRVYAITLDSSGNIYTTGYTNFSTSFLFLAKHDSSGNLLWFNRFSSGVSGTVGYSIKINSAGNLVVGGTYGYGTSAYTIPLILVLDTSGNLLSSVKMQHSSSSGTQNARFYSIALDSNDNIYATGIIGYTSGSAFGPIICKFDSSLSLLWANYLTPSTTATNYPSHGVTVDSLGNPYLSYFDRIAYSIKIVKFDPSGTMQWANKITTVGGLSSTNSPSPSNNLTNSLTSLIQVNVQIASSNSYGALAKVPLDGTRTGTGTYTVGPYGQPTTYASYTQTTTALNWFTETPTLSQLAAVMTTQTTGLNNYVTTQSSTTVFI